MLTIRSVFTGASWEGVGPGNRPLDELVVAAPLEYGAIALVRAMIVAGAAGVGCDIGGQNPMAVGGAALRAAFHAGDSGGETATEAGGFNLMIEGEFCVTAVAL